MVVQAIEPCGLFYDICRSLINLVNACYNKENFTKKFYPRFSNVLPLLPAHWVFCLMAETPIHGLTGSRAYITFLLELAVAVMVSSLEKVNFIPKRLLFQSLLTLAKYNVVSGVFY